MAMVMGKSMTANAKHTLQFAPSSTQKSQGKHRLLASSVAFQTSSSLIAKGTTTICTLPKSRSLAVKAVVTNSSATVSKTPTEEAVKTRNPDLATVLVAEKLGEGGLDLLRKVSNVDALYNLTNDELCEKISNYDALIVRSATKVTRKVFQASNGRLKVVGRAGVGIDNVDLDGKVKDGVPHLSKVGNFNVDVSLEGSIIFYRQVDQPGMIGKVGSILGEENVNIAFMSVGRTLRGLDAIVAIGTDEDLSKATIQKLADIPAIGELVFLKL